MNWLSPIFRYFESWIDPFQPREVYEPPRGLFAYLWFYARQFKWILLAVLAFGILNAIVEATIFTFVGDLVDMLAAFEAGNSSDRNWQAFWELHGSTLLWMVFIVVVARAIVVAAGALLEEQVVVPGFFTAMRWQGHKHVIQQSVGFFQNDLSGRVAQKVFQAGNTGGDLIIAVMQTVGFISAYALTTMAMVGQLDIWLAVTVVVWLILFVLLMRYFIPRIQRHGKITAEAASGTTGRLVDGYTNISTLKLYGHGDQQEGFIREALVRQYEALKRFTRDLTGVRVSLTLINNFMVLLIAWQALQLWFGDQITTGEVAFTLALVLRLNLLLGRMMGVLNGIFRMLGNLQNSMELIAQPIRLVDRPNAIELKEAKGAIKFEDVTFRYGKDAEVIENLNLELKPGERVGLIGRSGAGKSTIVNLLLRFFDVESGRVTLDGVDVRDVTQDSLRRHFGMVAQETALFHRSVRDNIAFGSPDAKEADIIKAAERAHAHDFIVGLEDHNGRKGYDARVGERGVKLSGGQRQRIAIARMMLRGAPILILDEATSALDSEVEAAIQENLFEMMEGKTVIAVAHRLSTIAALDRLIVIDGGRVVEEGSHETLLAKNGLYADLWKRQSGGFLRD